MTIETEEGYKAKIEDLESDLATEQEANATLRRQLLTAADLLAEYGLLPDTPHYKRMWVDGEREIMRPLVAA